MSTHRIDRKELKSFLPLPCDDDDGEESLAVQSKFKDDEDKEPKNKLRRSKRPTKARFPVSVLNNSDSESEDKKLSSSTLFPLRARKKKRKPISPQDSAECMKEAFFRRRTSDSAKSKSTHSRSDADIDNNDKNESSEVDSSELDKQPRKKSLTYQCIACVKDLKTSELYAEHMNKIHLRNVDGGKRKQFICPTCSKGFDTIYLFTKHLNRSHIAYQKVPLKNPTLAKRKKIIFTCKICKRQVISKDTFLKHQEYHKRNSSDPTKPFQCHICKIWFKKERLKFHLTLHQKDNPFVCKIAGCGKKFDGPFSLRKHVKLHKTQRQHLSCPHCPGTYSTERYLNRHILEYHTSQDKPKRRTATTTRNIGPRVRNKDHYYVKPIDKKSDSTTEDNSSRTSRRKKVSSSIQNLKNKNNSESKKESDENEEDGDSSSEDETSEIIKMEELDLPPDEFAAQDYNPGSDENEDNDIEQEQIDLPTGDNADEEDNGDEETSDKGDQNFQNNVWEQDLQDTADSNKDSHKSLSNALSKETKSPESKKPVVLPKPSKPIRFSSRLTGGSYKKITIKGNSAVKSDKTIQKQPPRISSTPSMNGLRIAENAVQKSCTSSNRVTPPPLLIPLPPVTPIVVIMGGPPNIKSEIKSEIINENETEFEEDAILGF